MHGSCPDGYRRMPAFRGVPPSPNFELGATPLHTAHSIGPMAATSAVAAYQEMTAEAMAARIAELAAETEGFGAEVSQLPQVPKFKGRLSKARQTFEHFDANGSGTIEFEEFLVIMARRIITTQGEMELEQALLLFKPDESGRVPCVDIRTMLGAYGEQPLEPDELEELLRLADPGGTGYCTVEALRSLPCWRLPIPADSGPT